MTGPLVQHAANESTVVQFETDIGTQPGTSGWISDAAGPALAGAAVLLELARNTSADRVEIRFGLKATGEASWAVSRALAEANFQVTLIWGTSATAAQQEAPAPTNDA